ncbi:hypothetical protein KAU34_06485, partial [candidate division WOR-3 bacterium]|nr:hypothetical protein [candidate division WOR-3 bacterium]
MRKRKKANKTMSVQKRDVSHTPSHSFTHLPSSSPVIRVHNLGKKYRIGKLRGYKTFRETIVDVAAAPFRHLRSGVKNLTN